ncbi:MAG: phage head morphogenesis protein [Azoarcus sp.]|jgi:hypothetical protein|nr:phage head morphogenesis protein [Azoarcus sp.]
MADTHGAFKLAFREQIEFFRRKINLPSERYDDIKRGAHDRGFIVAGATKAGLLDDLRAAVDRANADGGTLADFRKDFRALVAKHGWTGWTGEGTKAGEAWRTKVIWQTNLRTSHAAGRYAQLTDPETKKALPYWRYVHNDAALSPRPEHKHWGDARLTLPVDHPFWKTGYPPNGWGCGCYVVGEPAPPDGALTEPPPGWDEPDPETGRLPGIDQGWDYAPGANATTPLLDLVGQKLINVEAPIGAAMWESLGEAVAAEQRLALAEMADRVTSTLRAQGEAVLIGGVPPDVVTRLQALGHPMQSADIWLRDEELLHALREAKRERAAALPVEVWRDLPRLLRQGEAYFDAADPALVYVIDGVLKTGKVAIRVDYHSKLRDATSGKRKQRVANFIRTGGLLRDGDMSEKRYVKLGGGGGT